VVKRNSLEPFPLLITIPGKTVQASMPVPTKAFMLFSIYQQPKTVFVFTPIHQLLLLRGRISGDKPSSRTTTKA